MRHENKASMQWKKVKAEYIFLSYMILGKFGSILASIEILKEGIKDSSDHITFVFPIEMLGFSEYMRAKCLI